QYIEDRLRNPAAVNPRRGVLVHTGIEQRAVDRVREVIEDNFHFDQLMVTRAGSTISCHCGDNTLGVMFVRN
ncbi:MAG: DegV family protein, partial [bacterium]